MSIYNTFPTSGRDELPLVRNGRDALPLVRNFAATPTANCKLQNPNSRRGSALLVVLGMLAFMIVSAVAFAAYMRFSRLPSSYLRRTAASRQLVKAALARAIDEIDCSIGNNPHPGVGTTQTRYPLNTEPDEGEVGVKAERNIWLHRVFFGNFFAGEDSQIQKDPDDTVSPLTLEALAYIPPPLVNEARYLSRRSPAAAWKSLGFDAGRYAFCALDVSDYFDVNRIMANTARSSAGNRRVSLEYLFENDAHTSPGSDAASWDTWMEGYRNINENYELEWDSSKVPFVSLADFNLAFGYKNGIGNFKSPFYRFIESGTRNSFYEAKGDADLARLTRMTFVTDGLFPQEDETGLSSDEKTYELANPENQPFRINPSGSSGPSISDILMGGAHQRENEMSWHRRLGGVGLAALYDYLDPDHVPVSLAVPTTERVPMICGVQPTMTGAKLKITKTLEHTQNNGQDGNGDPSAPASADVPPRTVEQIVHYRLDPESLNLMGGAVNVVVVYPFSKDAGYSETFKVDGRLSFFFSTDDMGLRTNNSNPNTEVLHISDKGTIQSGVDANGLMNVALTGELPFNTQKAPASEDEAVKDITMTFMAGGVQELGMRLKNESKLLSVKYVWEQKPEQNGYAVGGLASYQWMPKFDTLLESGTGWSNEPEYTSDLCIVNAKGVKQDVKQAIKKGELNFNAAVWLRVKSKKGDTIVDMVPACLRDDSVANPSKGGPEAFPDGGEFGRYYPLMRFDTSGKGTPLKLPFTLAELDKMAEDGTASEINIWPQSAIVADPRFNHAPENWFAVEGNLSRSTWIDGNHAADNKRDGDIFMEVSDSGYLQSKYELAMLPACATLENDGQPTGQGSMKLFTTYNQNYIPDSFDSTVQGNFMWKTYDPVDTFADQFYDMKWVGDKKGYRVNPYSDSTNVIMAVLANTPMNWACAGTNDVQDADHLDYLEDAAGFNKNFAWNSYSSKAKFAWGDLQGVAGNFISKVRAKGGNWEDAWDDLGWYDDSGNSFCGVTLSSNTSDLWNVDRKFLYGYWKECFAAKQQLFLIFVRAEPVMMGGGGKGQIPPQLGARAVALVWRNPSTTNRKGADLPDDTPHQTRILFYRQLD